MIAWLQYRRWRNHLWGSMFEAFGDKPARPGVLRSKRSMCKALKLAERLGYYGY